MHTSSPILAPTARLHTLQQWAAATLALTETPQWTAIAGDAGNRRYYRLTAGDRRWMVADDAATAQLRQFIAVQKIFSDVGVRAPKIVAADTDNGFLIQEDFGDQSYWHVLPQDAERLYDDALTMLLRIQQATPQTLPPYDEALLRRETALFADWYCAEHCQRPLTAAARRIVDKAADYCQQHMRAQRQLPVHRDYHARNLMVLAEGDSPGVLDFQDAVVGAATYDMVSLLRDAYVEWDLSQQSQWLENYRRRARDIGIALPADRDEFWADYNISGAQRGLKVVGIFARLAHRDKKPRYLADLPLAHRHLSDACRQTAALKDLLTVVSDYPPSCAQ